MRTVRLLFLACLVVGVVPAPTTAQEEGPVCEVVREGSEPRPKVGRVFQSGFKNGFRDDNPHDHVPDGWSASANYGETECDRRIVDHDDAEHGNNVLEQEIFADSTSDKRSGDVSIYRSYEARRSDRYRVTARVDLVDPSGDFRGRLKVAPWHDNKAFTSDERFIDLCSSGSDTSNGNCVADDGDGFQEISFVADEFPRGTNIIKIAWRARETRDEDASGTAVLDWIRYVRID